MQHPPPYYPPQSPPPQGPGPYSPLSPVPVGRRRWGIPSALIGLALFLGVQLVVAVTFAVGWLVTGHRGAPPALTLGLASLLPAYLTVLGWQYLVSRRRGDGMRADYVMRFRWYDVFSGLGGGLLAMAGVFGGTVAVSELTGVDASSTVGTTVLESAQAGPVLYVFLLMVAFVGPVVEELHFRGMWWRALRNRMGPVLTLLLTSGVFAVIHLEPVRMAGLLLGGLVLGGLRLTFDRLGPSLIAHVLINSVAAGSLFYELALK